jgi:hypothetical protein
MDWGAVETRIIGTIVGWLVLQTGLAVMRTFFKIDPSLWLTGKLHGARRRHMADIVRWVGATAAVVLIWGLIWGAQLSISMFASHEGDPVTPLVDVIDVKVHQRNPNGPEPFGVIISESRDSSLKIYDECHYGWLAAPEQELTDAVITADFRTLIRRFDLQAYGSCGLLAKVPPKTYNKSFSIFFDDSWLPDEDVRQILNNSRTLYVLAVWRYRPVGSKTEYIQELCMFFRGNFDNPHDCVGDHNIAFVHLEK